jgi:parvulin-like peptidyl-prolyl isomerase
VHAALEKSPRSAAQVAAQFGVDVVTVNKAGAGEAIPTLGVSPEIDNALAPLPKNGVTPVLVLPANRMAIAVVTDKIDARPQEFSEAESKVRDIVLNFKAINVAQLKANEAAEKIRAGADMKTVAKSFKLDVTESAEFSRSDSVEGLGHSAGIPDAFTKPAGTIVGPVSVQNRSVVYKILSRQEADLTGHQAERAAILQDLKRRKGGQDFALFEDSVVTKLVAEGKVKINRDAIKRLVSSFHQ